MVAKAKKKVKKTLKAAKKDSTESKEPQEPKVESEGKAKPAAEKTEGNAELVQAAIAEVEKAIDESLQGKSRKNICKVPDDWHIRYKPTLGTWKKFVASQKDKFRVVDLANGNFAIHRASDELPAALTAKNPNKTWKKVLDAAWNMYAGVTPKCDRDVDTFLSTLPSGVRNTKPDKRSNVPAKEKDEKKGAEATAADKDDKRKAVLENGTAEEANKEGVSTKPAKKKKKTVSKS